MDKKLNQGTCGHIAHAGGSLISGGIDQNVRFDFCPKLPARLSKITPRYGKQRLSPVGPYSILFLAKFWPSSD